MAIEKLGKYDIRGTLGRGAMGLVYDGWDPIIERRVAIKTVVVPPDADPDTREGLERFRREAQAAGRLHHPNIVAVFDYSEADELAYIVMEFVDGRSLQSVIDEKKRLDLADTLRLMDEMLAAMQYSHERGVVHRDIKPSNIMLTTEGQCKIADFGIARIEGSRMTQAGTVMGTPTYMSPEQFTGQPVDARTDIYSAGVMLYQLLSGDLPFTGSMSAIMHKALNTTPPRPSELSVTAPAGFDAVVAQAMARRPEDRFATAAAFAEALRHAAATPAVAVPPPSDPEATMVVRPTIAPVPAPQTTAPPGISQPAAPAQAAKSGRGLMYAGVAVVVLALAGGGGYVLTRLKPEPVTASLEAPITAPVTAPVTAPAPAPAPVVAPTPVVAPVPTPAPPPPAPPTPPPQPPPPAAPSVAQIRAALAAAINTVPCALASADLVDASSAVRLSGMAASGEPTDALRRAVETAAGGHAVTWQAESFTGPFCPVLDIRRPLPPALGATSGLTFALDQGRTTLHDGDPLLLRLGMPEFPAYLLVDYVQQDGLVWHNYPAPNYPARLFPAGSRQTLGEPNHTPNDTAHDFAGWTVGEPFGRDMVLVIASSAPLAVTRKVFDTAEPSAPYLRDLRSAIEAARKRGVQVEASVLLLDTKASGQ